MPLLLVLNYFNNSPGRIPHWPHAYLITLPPMACVTSPSITAGVQWLEPSRLLTLITFLLVSMYSFVYCWNCAESIQLHFKLLWLCPTSIDLTQKQKALQLRGREFSDNYVIPTAERYDASMQVIDASRYLNDKIKVEKAYWLLWELSNT